MRQGRLSAADDATSTTAGIGRPAGTGRRGAKYAAIRDWLARGIEEGTFPQGTLLPSEHHLMAQFDVSRVTVRQAIESLRASGLVETRQGKGTFAAPRRVAQSLSRLLSFSETAKLQGAAACSRVVEVREVQAERCAAAALGLSPPGRLTRIVRERLIDGAVAAVQVSFFEPALGRRLAVLDLERNDIILLLEHELRIEIGHADIELDMTPASKGLEGRLGVRSGEPVVRLVRVTHDSGGEPLAFERIYARWDRVQFSLRLQR